MSKDLNVITITGRLTKDPEIKTPGEFKVANFSIASDMLKKKEKYTNFFNCFTFDENFLKTDKTLNLNLTLLFQSILLRSFLVK